MEYIAAAESALNLAKKAAPLVREGAAAFRNVSRRLRANRRRRQNRSQSNKSVGGQMATQPNLLRSPNGIPNGPQTYGLVGSIATTDPGRKITVNYGNAPRWNGTSGLRMSGTLPWLNLNRVTGSSGAILKDQVGVATQFFLGPTNQFTHPFAEGLYTIAGNFTRYFVRSFTLWYAPQGVSTSDTGRYALAVVTDPAHSFITEGFNYSDLITIQSAVTPSVWMPWKLVVPIGTRTEPYYIGGDYGTGDVEDEFETRFSEFGVIMASWSDDQAATATLGMIYADFVFDFYEMAPQGASLQLARMVRQDLRRELRKKKIDEAQRKHTAQRSELKSSENALLHQFKLVHYPEQMEVLRKHALEQKNQSSEDGGSHCNGTCLICKIEFTGAMGDEICANCHMAVRKVSTVADRKRQ